MGDIRFFVGLVKLLDDSATELGLGSLTELDRQVLAALWDGSGQPGELFEASHKGCAGRVVELFGSDLSRAQFYKSLTKLEDLGKIRRVGGRRSKTYVFV